MRQKRLILLFALFLVMESSAAWAQLNSNPWLNANDEENVAKVYAKRARRRRGNTQQNYQAEETVTIDRTHAYIQDTETDAQNESLLKKVTNSISGQAEEKPLIANTKENRQKLAQQKKAEAAAKEQDNDDSLFALPNIGGQTAKLPRSISQPLAQAKGMLNKFKRTTAGSLKAISKQFK